MKIYNPIKLDKGFSVTEISSFFQKAMFSSCDPSKSESYKYWAMLYTVKGSLDFKIDGKILSVSSGDLIFYPPNVPHGIVKKRMAEWEVCFVTFSCNSEKMTDLQGKIHKPSAETRMEILNCFHKYASKFHPIPNKPENSYGMLCTADDTELLDLKLRLESILLLLYTSVKKDENTILTHNHNYSKIFYDVTAYMKENLGKQLSLLELATVGNVSISTLKNVFKKEAGCGIINYYINLKLLEATRRLRETNDSIGSIAESLGFSSQFYFSKQFKKVYTISPMAYRKSYLENCRIELNLKNKI